MTEHLELEPDSRVLEIGTGCGYQTAVLTEITPHVFSIERIPALLKKANRVLYKLGYKSVKTLLGDGSLGWEQHAPFDAIMVTAAAPKVPAALIEQLSEGGRIVIPLQSERHGGQELVRLRKQGGRISREKLYDVRFVPMIGEVEE
jgi:protein-L-isoaspartate(D-aspartate) O-methyltransferase